MAKIQYREIGIGAMRIAINIAVVLVVAFLFYAGFTRAYRLGIHVFTDDAAAAEGSGTEYEFTVIEGQSALTIGKSLEEKGIIVDAFAFYLQSIVYEVKPAPGTYEISSEQSSKEILKLMEGED